MGAIQRFLYPLLAALMAVSALGVPSEAKAGADTLYLLHDVQADGFTYVGTPAHFGYVLLDADGTTSVHKQGIIRVVQNGVTLYETSEDAGHDYDALNTFEITFPVPGPYEVYAEVPLGGSVKPSATFTGFAHPAPDSTTNATIEIGVPGTTPDGTPIPITVNIVNETGATIPHSDAILEVRRPGDQWLAFRTHLHSHADPMTLHYMFPDSGEWLVRVVGYVAYPTKADAYFAPVYATKTVMVTPGQPGSGSAGVGAPPSGTPSGEEKYRLYTSIDPASSNTPWSRMAVSGLVYDVENDTFVQHVNFEARIDEPVGHVVFDSKSLHEYDGVYDVVMNFPYPSTYTLTLKATYGAWVGLVEKTFTVAVPTPPTPMAAGAVIVTAEGLEGLKSGTPTEIVFHAATAAGTPAGHSEIDFQVLRETWGAPILQNKVHTHDDGAFAVSLVFPEEGDYLLVVDPVTIHGEPTPQYFFGEFGGDLVVPLTVAFGQALPIELPAMEEDFTETLPEGNLPGLEAAVAVAAIAGLAVALRRRG